MIKIENVVTSSPEQWRAIIMGLRNPMNSWHKSDSDFNDFKIGENDHDLMMRLRNAGTDHRKYMRMITVYADITAPLYWWKQYSTYKVGTVENSCSSMHKIHAKEFAMGDFSCEHLTRRSKEMLDDVIDVLNHYRDLYLNGGCDYISDNDQEDYEPKDKHIWWQIIQLLPSSYNQKRAVMLNYEVLANIYKSRKGHNLTEWSDFLKWIESLPYSEIITGNTSEN